jgi:hypothetical protein
MHWWESLVDAAWSRFIAKVDVRDPLGCWTWTGARSRGRGNTAWYSSFNVGQRTVVRAHIFVCVAAGYAVRGLHVDHLCGNTLCVNPVHLEPVTPTENALRRWAGRRKIAA